MGRKLTAWALAGVLAGTGAARAADDDAKALKEQVEALRKEMAELKATLKATIGKSNAEAAQAIADARRARQSELKLRAEQEERLHAQQRAKAVLAEAEAQRAKAEVQAKLAMDVMQHAEAQQRLAERQQQVVEAEAKKLADRAAVADAALADVTVAGKITVAHDENHQRLLERLLAVASAHAKPETYLGVMTEAAGAGLATQLGLPSGQGLLVTEVIGDSPAAKAGLKKFDVIVAIDGHAAGTPEELKKLVVVKKAGETAEVTVRTQGHPKTLAITLGVRKDPGGAEELHRLLTNGQGKLSALTFAGQEDQTLAPLEALAKKRPDDKDLAEALAAAKKAAPHVAVWGRALAVPDIRQVKEKRFNVRVAPPAPPSPPKPSSGKVKEMSINLDDGRLSLKVSYALPAGGNGTFNASGAVEEVREQVKANKDMPEDVRADVLRAVRNLKTNDIDGTMTIRSTLAGPEVKEVRVEVAAPKVEIKKGQ